MKLLHLVKDEKFPDSAYEFFESVAPDSNIFMLAGTENPIRHLEKITPVRVSRYAYFSPKFIKSLNDYDAIIMHSLFPFALEVLARIGRRVPSVWIGMGYDYYDLMGGGKAGLLKKETKKICKRSARKIRMKPRRIFRSIGLRLLQPNAFRKKKLVKKIDLFAPVLQSEYALVRDAVGAPFPEYVRWNYSKIADLLDGRLGNKTVVGNNILVGNSAAPTNNHLDAFYMLVKAGIPSSSDVVVPLSYGNSDYRKNVISEGERLFGSQFKPITEFVSMEEYIDLLCSCSCVIMNHLRQQAAGNLLIALYLGSKIYLDLKNPLYEEIKSMELPIHSLNEFSGVGEDLGKPLETELLAKHREILKSARGRVALEQCTENLIAKLMRIAQKDERS